MNKRFLAVLVVLLVGSASFAGFVNGTFLCTFPDDPQQTFHNWNFNDATDHLTLAENIHVLGFDQVNMSGVTDSDPTFHVTKTVTNSSGYTWTSYELLLGAGSATFVGTPFTDKFGTAVISNAGLKITYSSPLVVLPGQTVVLDFDINVPSTGSFGFCLTQNPIPEPATLAILGLGGLLLRKRR